MDCFWLCVYLSRRSLVAVLQGSRDSTYGSILSSFRLAYIVGSPWEGENPRERIHSRRRTDAASFAALCSLFLFYYYRVGRSAASTAFCRGARRILYTQHCFSVLLLALRSASVGACCSAVSGVAAVYFFFFLPAFGRPLPPPGHIIITTVFFASPASASTIQ